MHQTDTGPADALADPAIAAGDAVPGTDTETVALLAALGVPGVGPHTLRVLVQHFGSADALLSSDARTLRAQGVSPKLADALAGACGARARADIDAARRLGCLVLAWHHARYPAPLLAIPDPPPVLFVRGRVDALNGRVVAMVGARRPTPSGARLAGTMAAGLAARGWTIASGLALGIDGEAHAGALSGGGASVAVLGCGPDRIYPARHARLARALIRDGAVVTEFPPGTPVHPGHFPRRNRIVSGLARAVVVIEAGRRSGSLITARLALEQGRDVMAVPGAPTNPLAAGTNGLLRDGAALVTSAEHVLAELGEPVPDDSASSSTSTVVHARGSGADAGIDDEVLRAIGAEPLDVDALASRVGAPAAMLLATLSALELSGRAARTDGARWMATGV